MARVYIRHFMRSFLQGVIVWAMLWTTGWATSDSPHAAHVFIVSIDGGKPAVIAESDMPVLKQLVKEGACTWTASTIFPSVTLPSHTSMLTGVGPDKHHVLWNSWQPRKGVVAVPTIFAEAKRAGFSTAMFVGKEKFRHLAQPDSIDVFEFPEAEAKASGTVVAKTVAGRAARYIVENKPTLCFIHFTDPDDAGHQYGWGSPQQIRAFGEVDEALGEILEAMKVAGISQESVLMVTADHGGHDKTHGQKRPEDMRIPWIAWGKGAKRGFAISDPVITYDTAATALWVLGLPVPEPFDGKPVTSAFEGQADPLTTQAHGATARKGVGF